MEEILDIVNELDVVVGQATRKRVHEEQLMHRATHIILCDSKQRVFLQLRSKTKDTNPGLWDTSAAGHVDAGESYIGCAVRELEEELGVALQTSELQEVDRIGPSEHNGFEFVRIYVACSDQPIKLEAQEIDDGRWVSVSELERLLIEHSADFTSTFKVIWDKYRSWSQKSAARQ